MGNTFPQDFKKEILIFISNYYSVSFPLSILTVSPEGQILITELTRAVVLNLGSIITPVWEL